MTLDGAGSRGSRAPNRRTGSWKLRTRSDAGRSPASAAWLEEAQGRCLCQPASHRPSSGPQSLDVFVISNGPQICDGIKIMLIMKRSSPFPRSLPEEDSGSARFSLFSFICPSKGVLCL